VAESPWAVAPWQRGHRRAIARWRAAGVAGSRNPLRLRAPTERKEEHHQDDQCHDHPLRSAGHIPGVVRADETCRVAHKNSRQPEGDECPDRMERSCLWEVGADGCQDRDEEYDDDEGCRLQDARATCSCQSRRHQNR